MESSTDSQRDLTAHLQAWGRGDSRLLHRRDLPERPPRFTDWPNWVPQSLKTALHQSGSPRPWLHQAAAADSIYTGHHTVLATGTGSGKSLAAWVPHLAKFLDTDRDTRRISSLHRLPTALYLAPTKALAADQITALQKLCSAFEPALPLRMGAADGDAEAQVKDWIRSYADIVATNPDFLHHALLANHSRWQRFLSGLQTVVVDEAHHYRGVFGAHVALILRRLLRLANHYNAHPQVVFLSATIADPHSCAQRFLGENTECRIITDDGSPAGARTVLLWQPGFLPGSNEDGDSDSAFASWGWQTVDSEDGWDESILLGPSTPSPGETTAAVRELRPRQSSVVEAAQVTAELLSQQARTLTFVHSRAATEAVATMVRQQLHGSGLKAKIRAYRGGYLPEERRHLEKDLRQGTIQALTTTSALELGIDVSSLDASVTAGWPGTLASLWQQMGRVGRAGRAGLSVVILGDDPLETYVKEHPQVIFDPVETSVFDPHNPYVLAPHLCAAAAELPLQESELPLFGLPDSSHLATLEQQGVLLHRPGGWYWDVTHPERPHSLVDLRGGGAEITLVEADTGQVVGSVPENRADSTAHPGAIYVHQGRVYEVVGRDTRTALLRPGQSNLRTRANADTSVRIMQEFSCHPDSQGLIDWHFGQVEVVTQVTSFDLLRLPGLQFLRQDHLKLPERSLITTAVWWTLSPRAQRHLHLDPSNLPGALHAIEHCSIGLLPLVATCDRWDLGGLSQELHPDTKLPTVFVYDGVRGGAGFAQRGFTQAKIWAEAVFNRLRECACDDGCPRCVVSPKCGSRNDPLDKPGALELAELVLASTQDAK